MDNITYVIDGLLLFAMLGIGGVIWFDLTGRMKKLNNNQVTTMKFILDKFKGNAPAPAAAQDPAAKPESEILTNVGTFLLDEIEAHSVVTTFKPGSSEYVRIVDLDTWNKIIDSLRSGVMPVAAVQVQAPAPVAVPGPVGADPAAPAASQAPAADMAAVQTPAPKTRQRSSPAAIAALKAANERRREAKAKAKAAAQVLVNQVQAPLVNQDQAA